MSSPGQLSLDDLALLRRAVSHACGRYHLSREDVEDCLSDLVVKLLAHDGAVLRRHEGRCSRKTFLVTVANNHVKDFVNGLWGKWRPCEEATRLGGTALELDRLLSREGLELEEALETLLSRPEVTASREELEEMAARFPARSRPKIVPDAELEARPTREDSPEQAAAKSESASVFKSMVAILHEELAQLDPEDKLLLDLWAGGTKISAIAKRLGRDQKSLYTVRDRLLSRLRERFEQAGLEPDRARAVLRLGDWSDEGE